MEKDKQGDKGTAREVRTTGSWHKDGTDGDQLLGEVEGTPSLPGEELAFFKH